MPIPYPMPPRPFRVQKPGGFHRLLTAAGLILAAVLWRDPQAWAVTPDASRTATFVGIKGRDTLFVERVSDVPGGFRGEVSVPRGGVWIRYRVELGPRETIRRYELDMNSMAAAARGDAPEPLLVARHERDSILIEARPGMGLSSRRLAVPASAILATTEMALFEQAIRHGLRSGRARVEFPMVSAWTGQSRDAVVVRKSGDKVRLETGRDIWEFAIDRQVRIVSGTRVSGSETPGDPFAGVRIVRLGPG